MTSVTHIEAGAADQHGGPVPDDVRSQQADLRGPQQERTAGVQVPFQGPAAERRRPRSHAADGESPNLRRGADGQEASG